MPGQVRLVRPLGPVVALSLLAVATLVGPSVDAAPERPGRCAVPVDPSSSSGADDLRDRAVRVDVAPADGSRAADLDTDEVRFARRGQPAGTTRVSPTWIEVPGQGTWTVDADSGDVVLTPPAQDDAVVFSPEEGYDDPVGAAEPSGPTSDTRTDGTDGTDAADQVPPPTLVAPCDALGLPDSGETDQGVGVTLRPLDNDLPGADDGEPATFVGSTVELDYAALPDGADLRDDRLRVPGEGVWTVGEAGRTVGFEPVPGFTGRTAPVRYAATDSAGHDLSSVMRVDVGSVAPSAAPDTARTTQATAVGLDVLANDEPGAESAPLDPATVRLLVDDGAVGEGPDVLDTVEVDGEGTWSVADGELGFVPAADFVGTTAPVRYAVADANGTRATSTAQVAVAPVAEAVGPRDDSVRTPYETSVLIPVLANDEPRGLRTTGAVSLIGNSGVPVGQFTARGEGLWKVEGRQVRFTPVDEFSGEATAVRYRVEAAGGAAARATIRLTVEAPGEALPTEVTTTSGTAVTATVLDNVTPAATERLLTRTLCVRPAQVRVDGALLKADGDASRCVDDHRRPDVGRWQVDDRGVVTFTPDASFTGRAAIGWRVDAVLDNAAPGGDVYASSLAVEVTAPTTTPGVRTSTTPVTTTTTTTTTPAGSLPDTGGPTFLALLGGLGLLAAGGVVLRRSRRRA